ncbi:YdcH family protein [Thalassospira australica]|uniref:YdcH family protein n=1 Tax=Thalassospira australica TaxID=1528106 RepID=UPI00384D460D
MDEINQIAIEKRLLFLREEHRDLDIAIEQLAHGVHHDQLRLGRMKKRKLALKDEILYLESQLVPDIIA